MNNFSAYLKMVYASPTAHNPTATLRLPVRAITRDGAVKIPVPTILLTIREKTSNVVRGPAASEWSAAASSSMSKGCILGIRGACSGVIPTGCEPCRAASLGCAAILRANWVELG